MITTSENEIDLEMNKHSSKEAMKEMTLQDYMEMVEKEFILRMYQKYPSSVKIAKKLGVSQSMANRKMRKYIRRVLVIIDHRAPIAFNIINQGYPERNASERQRSLSVFSTS